MSTLIAHSTSSEISSGFLHQPSEGWSGLQVFEYSHEFFSSFMEARAASLSHVEDDVRRRLEDVEPERSRVLWGSLGRGLLKKELLGMDILGVLYFSAWV